MSTRYPLIQGPNSPQKKFIELCELYSLDYLPTLKAQVATALQNLRAFEMKFLGPDLSLAEALAARCNLLLENYPKMNDGDKRLAIGAIRYFIVDLDELPDATPVVGLDDDVAVMNHVLERLGLADKAIT